MPWIITATLSVFVPLILIYYYLGRRLLNAIVMVTRWERNTVRRIAAGIICYLNLFPLLFLLIFLLWGQQRVPLFSGESTIVDILLIYPFWFSLVIAVQLFFLFLLSELARLFFLPVYRRNRQSWLRKQSLITVCLTGLVTLYSVAVIVKDTWTVRVVERNVRLPSELFALDGLRIVHISDVQGDGRTSPDKLERYVEQVNSLKPDLVLFSGDLVTSGEGYISSTADIMGRIEATYGKIAAVGDHDIFSNKRKVIDALSARGFTIADDTSFTFSINSMTITVTVLTQTYRQRPHGRELAKIAGEANGHFKILLVHQPAESLVEFARREGYQLFLAGHTHGGGITFRIPGLGLFAPARLESRYFSGFYEIGSLLVSVTNGLGMTLAPIRFQAPAEITLLRLTR